MRKKKGLEFVAKSLIWIAYFDEKWREEYKKYFLFIGW